MYLLSRLVVVVWPDLMLSIQHVYTVNIVYYILYGIVRPTAPVCQNDKRDPERWERRCKYSEWQESFQYNSVTADQNIHNMRSRFLQQSRQNITQYFTILKVYEGNVKLTNINITMIETLHCWEVTLTTLSPASKCTCGVKNFCSKIKNFCR